MLQNRTAAAAYWEQVGRQALEQGVERIVMMGAHWETARGVGRPVAVR
jgi:aromatic ring-opening dioxygenase catalytic subunit (LigB family)